MASDMGKAYGGDASGDYQSSLASDGDDMGSDPGASDVPPEFEARAAEAFPDLQDDPARMSAFWKAIQACVDGGKVSSLDVILGAPKKG